MLRGVMAHTEPGERSPGQIRKQRSIRQFPTVEIFHSQVLR